MVTEMDELAMNYIKSTKGRCNSVRLMEFLLERGYTEKQSMRCAYEFRYIVNMVNRVVDYDKRTK